MATPLPTKHSSYQRKLVVCGALIIVLGLLQPVLWRRVEAAARALRERQTQTAQQAELAARLAVLQTAAHTQQDLLSQLDVVVPSRGALSQVIERLEQTARQQAVVLDIVEITEQPDSETASEVLPLLPVRVQVNARSSPSQLLRYLEMVEHLPELALIETWSLLPAPPAATPTPGAYQLAMTVVFFLQR